MTAIRKRLCIIGERGSVSQMLQARLAKDTRFEVTVLSTDTATSSPSTSEILCADLVVLCTLEFSSPQIVAVLSPGIRVLDVSPAFRTHADWVYGLPELPGAHGRIQAAARVANPGCFATSAVLALEPLVRAGLVAPGAQIYLDAVGGYTTGGQAMVEKAVAGNLAAESAYSLTREHRHTPEIQHFCGLTGPLWFSPKIANVPRGIRMQVPLPGLTREQVLRTYRTAYAGTSIVVEDECPSKIPVDDWAGRSGACLRVFEQPSGCLAVCVLDNMEKGAVGGAFENIALMLRS